MADNETYQARSGTAGSPAGCSIKQSRAIERWEAALRNQLRHGHWVYIAELSSEDECDDGNAKHTAVSLEEMPEASIRRGGSEVCSRRQFARFNC